MNFHDIEWGLEESYMDGPVKTAQWHDGHGISYTARRLESGEWAVYFAMDLKTAEVFWSHGVDLFGVRAKVLRSKDNHVLQAASAAHDNGATSWRGVMAMAALEFEGQERLI